MRDSLAQGDSPVAGSVVGVIILDTLNGGLLHGFRNVEVRLTQRQLNDSGDGTGLVVKLPDADRFEAGEVFVEIFHNCRFYSGHKIILLKMRKGPDAEMIQYPDPSSDWNEYIKKASGYLGLIRKAQ